MTLENFDILNGIFNLVFVGISIVLGIIILRKYFKNRNPNFIFMGTTLIFLTSGWYGTSASFLVAVIFGNEGLSFELIMLLNFIPLPFGLISWIIVFTNLLYKNFQKIILGMIVIITIFFYVVFIYALFTNPNSVGNKISPVDTSGNSLFLLSYVFIFIIIVLVTGIRFAYETMNYEDSETKWKGRLLMLAFPTFCIGGFLDSTITSSELTLIIFRIILIISAFEFYGGFILPKWLKKLLIKKEQEGSSTKNRL
ncbi:MAG: hypothetical protein GF317_15655 [Candidatus Lokiarchaeota archaeon]|nr:hypothetical protein [Candidatus Lokiarchaeota archaeon]MBD3200999.1 hypothetical protein [Candidatus Lokiarchaeota archaeon]